MVVRNPGLSDSRQRTRGLPRRFVWRLGLLAALGCEDGNMERRPIALPFRVTPTALTLVIGDTARIVARDHAGGVPVGLRFEATHDAVRVDSSGLVTADKAGAALVIVRANAGSMSVPASVRPR